MAAILSIALMSLSVRAFAAPGTDYFKISSELIHRQLIKRDPSLSISVETVLQKIKTRQKMVLVDVRDKEAFERLRIPGSLNIPLYVIKAKPFLRLSPLVVVNEGFRYSQLEKECKKLRNAGFTVSILNGGLNSWGQKGGLLEGDLLALRACKAISPRIFFQEKDYENWIILDVSREKKPESQYLMPYALHIPILNCLEGPELRRRISKSKPNPFLSVLIFNENGTRYERFAKALRRADLVNAFFLKGGLRAYRRFLEDLSLSWQSKQGRMKIVNKCRTCGQRDTD